MYQRSEDNLYLGLSDHRVCLLPAMANRHGLIAGATGTGKTITLKVMAESFSDAGVPVFVADIKGDLAGMALPGEDNAGMRKRITRFGLEGAFEYRGFPTRYWDVFAEGGHAVRATVSDMGPLLLSRLMNLTPVQSGVMDIVFRVADDQGLLLIDIKDLSAMLRYVGEHCKELTLQYGNVSPQSVGAILRAVLSLEDQGGGIFFGEPMLDIKDWTQFDERGSGYINVLDCVKLFQAPKLYGTFLLWMLSEIYEALPEAGDLDRPRMVFFFDEAHLLFDDAPKALVEKIEQVVRLIRSKAVGVYFVTQNPLDVPGSVLAQLGNRVQHALRAYTPAEQKAVRTAADTFRANPAFKTDEAITQLGTGEALISFLDEEGRPGMVQRCFVLPPESKMGAIDDDTRFSLMDADALGCRYDRAVDRDSAYEHFEREREQEAREAERLQKAKEREAAREQQERERASQSKQTRASRSASTRSRRMSPLERVTSSVASSFGRTIGTKLARGLLGGLLK